MNTKKTNNRWIKYSRYLSNEMKTDEKQLFLRSIDSNNNEKKLFEAVKGDWNIMKKPEKTIYVDVDKAWSSLKSKIQENYPESIHSQSKFYTTRIQVLGWAATVLILIGISIGIKVLVLDNAVFTPGKIVQTTLQQEQQEVVLSDGSVVYLNASSRLIYPKRFNKNTREVELQGEAFFDISANAKKPFIITAGDAIVKVVGTSFNVNAGKTDNKTEVFVESGKVELYYKNIKNDKIVIEPGYVGVLDKKILALEHNTNENIMAWKTKTIVFKETSLLEVVEVLNEVYHTTIFISDKEIENLKYNGTLMNQPLENVLEVLQTAFSASGLKIDTSNQNKIIFKKV